jgi:hypothetical protein
MERGFVAYKVKKIPSSELTPFITNSFRME